ncbi:uncharacterized protein [Apostichopus japonicus]|uniref:uncharacterized protein n=1 Tax=Stichopus japonicus TaxID=307972 RepID=UPI003AB6B534
MSGMKEEILATSSRFVKLYADKDFIGLSNLFTEDCKLLPFGSPMVEGREVIAKIFQGLYDSGFTTLQSETVEIGAAGGDVTYSISFYKFFLADGKVAQDGKLVKLWKRVNGKLLVYIDIFNTNSP